MAKAPDSVNGWAGDGDVWFKVYQISAVTNGGESITFPAEGMIQTFVSIFLPENRHVPNVGVPGVTFTLPEALPSGQ